MKEKNRIGVLLHVIFKVTMVAIVSHKPCA